MLCLANEYLNLTYQLESINKPYNIIIIIIYIVLFKHSWHTINKRAFLSMLLAADLVNIFDVGIII